MKAQQAIDKIKSEKLTIFGQTVTKANYPIETRRDLQLMAERGEISPKEFYTACKITFGEMSDIEKRVEKENLS